jgi:hypothetical protein
VLAAALLSGLAVPTMFGAPQIGAQETSTERKAEMKAAKRTVSFGSRLRVVGRFPDSAADRVEIVYRRAGTNWKVKARTTTSSKGLFRARVRPQASGWWRAELVEPEAATEPSLDAAAAPARDTRTGNRRVLVRSRTSARVSSSNIVVGRKVRVSGKVRPADGGRRVVIHAGGSDLRTRTSRNGSFSRTWRPKGTGTYRVKASAKGNVIARGSSDRAGKVQVFRPAAASWYGPGFYGNRTACGQTLTTSTVGVAHKSMSCGTRVTLRYGGREVTVPVIDRGPYAGNREFDLTSATRNRLNFPSTGTVLSSR